MNYYSNPNKTDPSGQDLYHLSLQYFVTNPTVSHPSKSLKSNNNRPMNTGHTIIQQTRTH